MQRNSLLDTNRQTDKLNLDIDNEVHNSGHCIVCRCVKKILKFAISIYLFTYQIITQEPMDQFASKFYWGTRETHGNVLSLILRF